MDILNWVYLIKNKFTRTTVENPATDLIVLGADVSYAKRGDKYQNYVMTVEDFAASLTSAPLPVLTTYPTTTPSSAGSRFLYQGNEWHYMTQAEIDSAGWTGLVTVGFPAPVDKSTISKYIYFNGSDFTVAYSGNLSLGVFNGIVDFIGLGDPSKITIIAPDSSAESLMPYGKTITEFKNAVLLSNLKDQGTTAALRFINNGLSSSVINSLFTQLPPTTNTVTINVNGNPGAGTCDPTIATAKGYTVIV